MPVTRTTTGHFTFAGWKEEPVTPEGAHPRLAHATVTNAFSGGIEAGATTCDYAIAYLTGTTGTFAGMELVGGRVDGREGTFVLEERGRFEADGTVHCSFEVVEGSGTEGLTGLRGTGGFTYRHGETEVAYTFAYELE
ncbi:DUF3224 domain-containing protein [Streptomyces griseomycini]|uniref:DUF3224 domain-containing protein n=1 Tax=Streptomyces griseomycini TaxID=66895 RepID=A0A7W7PSH8_9ACTN|nr:DUF3224 domain-containing protein [Streptomyces griseomycini]MBB4900363.1 hypothetical protein [Streptomyces griseomycini]GGQ24535.1 hypothetical protein GCM10010266_54680 [Streptomyces griseomycini]GGR38959.1 hypothetical protein GCM10015536_50930 [Streptomyces griseomycini]